MGELQVDVTDEFNASTGVRVATVDNGDGTGTRTDYTTDPPTVTQLSGLPIPTPPPPDLDEVFASVPVVSLEEANDTLLALKAALEARGIV